MLRHLSGLDVGFASDRRGRNVGLCKLVVQFDDVRHSSGKKQLVPFRPVRLEHVSDHVLRQARSAIADQFYDRIGDRLGLLLFFLFRLCFNADDDERKKLFFLESSQVRRIPGKTYFLAGTAAAGS